MKFIISTAAFLLSLVAGASSATETIVYLYKSDLITVSTDKETVNVRPMIGCMSKQELSKLEKNPKILTSAIENAVKGNHVALTNAESANFLLRGETIHQLLNAGVNCEQVSWNSFSLKQAKN